MRPLVSVSVLNYKQRAYVPLCLDAVMAQTYDNIEVLFSDNGSADGSAEYVRARYPEVKVIAHDANLYYCRAQNIAIAQSGGEYVLTLNVDVRVTATLIEEMVRATGLDPKIGMVSGKLVQLQPDFRPVTPAVIDSTGIWFSREMRHFDRGQGETDRGQYERVEYVFGPSGAAALYRREMLEDIAFQGEYFDEDFVIYREDADLAWRAQLFGWRGLYAPRAVAFHVRRLRPDRRRENVRELNMHSVKNRFLMRVKNQTWANALRCFVPTLWRDSQVVGYVFLVEHSSLPGLSKAARLFPRALTKRKQIMREKRVSDDYIAQWFSDRPRSLPFEASEEAQP